MWRRKALRLSSRFRDVMRLPMILVTLLLWGKIVFSLHQIFEFLFSLRVYFSGFIFNSNILIFLQKIDLYFWGFLTAIVWVQKSKINNRSAIHNKLTDLYTCWKSIKAKDIPRIPTVAITVMNNGKCVSGSLIFLFSLAPGGNRSAVNDVGLYSKWRYKCC